MDTTTAPVLLPAAAPLWAAPLRAVDAWDARIVGEALQLTGQVRVDAGDPNLRGHFPGLPVYPGVFVIETVHQLVGLVLPDSGGAPPVLREVRAIRFLAPMLGGDELTITARMTPAGGDGWLVEGDGRRGDGALTVTFTLLLESSVGLEIAGPEAPPLPVLPADGARDHAAIRAALPQRHPLLLVDRVVGRDATSIRTEKLISGTDPCYVAVPDDAPAAAYAYPASLLVEVLGQSAGLLWLDGREALGPDELLLFATARGIRFEATAHPGDRLDVRLQLDSVVAGTAFASGEVQAGGRLVATVRSIVAARRPRTALPELDPTPASNASPAPDSLPASDTKGTR